METLTQQFYYLRHHRTLAHDQELICGGQTDLPLSESSVEYMLHYGEHIAACLQNVRAIYTTNLVRARQTAEAVNVHLNLPIKEIANLKEWCLGDWEGQKWNDLPHPFTFEGKPPNGEARSDFRNRIRQSVTELLHTGEVFLIVAHGIVFHELSDYFTDQPEYIETAELVELCHANKQWTLKRIPYL
ncbi:histidine phosphatase family protein [Dyadobacter sp. CY347]|uniref:histidine phosphatase family protein n=1 Tax=Dyadobacter sp. CY347 TaxID=2909336 RepID=UPI001F175DE4|nr:histidine phosphatase family protein [Dyadobacter sp. CY347]MCF2487524.1 histidine phosphatase family protein [Dyadobacter sp. CY347]